MSEGGDDEMFLTAEELANGEVIFDDEEPPNDSDDESELGDQGLLPTPTSPVYFQAPVYTYMGLSYKSTFSDSIVFRSKHA